MGINKSCIVTAILPGLCVIACVLVGILVGQQSGGRCDHDTGDPAYHMRRYCCLDGSNLSDSDMESVGSTWESVSSVEEDMDQAGAMGHSSSASTNGHDYASFNNSSTSSLSIKADVAYASFGLVKSLVFNASKGNSVGIASPTLQYYMEKQLMMELFKSNAGAGYVLDYCVQCYPTSYPLLLSL